MSILLFHYLIISFALYFICRHYQRNKKGHLTNTPYVDNSYKWAGGGFLSNVGDLLKFGNAMLYASQVGRVEVQNESLLPGLLSQYIILYGIDRNVLSFLWAFYGT